MTFLQRRESAPGEHSGDIFGFRNDFFSNFDNIFQLTDEGRTQKSFQPVLNIEESEKAYFIDAELAGVPKEAIDISLKDHVLTIKGEKSVREEKGEREQLRIERSFGSFSRSIRLPNDIDSEKVTADYENGVLFITIEKADQSKSHRKISIK